MSDSDPVEMCSIYKEQGCSHVDGLLCDFPECQMLKDYLKEKDSDKKMCVLSCSKRKRDNDSTT